MRMCLVAHGDLNETNKLIKFYQADRIIKELEELHPDFFPVAVIQKVLAPNLFQWPLKESGFLTKAEFIKLYN